MYNCGNCGKVVETGEGGVRCPFCGYKILFKARSGEVRTVLAR
ncbi:MAG: DNA-directed RNA polymerase subunit P [Candidatus Hydrothermarchaeaceae archaeon]